MHVCVYDICIYECIIWCFSDRASWIDYILITNLMHWLLFIHKILFSSTCFEPQVLIFRRIKLYTCSIWYCHSLREFVVACRYTAWVRTDCRGKVVGGCLKTPTNNLPQPTGSPLTPIYDWVDFIFSEKLVSMRRSTVEWWLFVAGVRGGIVEDFELADLYKKCVPRVELSLQHCRRYFFYDDDNDHHHHHHHRSSVLKYQVLASVTVQFTAIF